MKRKYKILLAIIIVSLFGVYIFNSSKVNLQNITDIKPIDSPSNVFGAPSTPDSGNSSNFTDQDIEISQVITFNDTHFVVVWVDGNYDVYARLGIKNDSNLSDITWGIESSILTSATINRMEAIGLNQTHFVVAWANSSMPESDGYGWAEVGRINPDSTITFGDPVSFTDPDSVYDFGQGDTLTTQSIGLCALNETKFLVMFTGNYDNNITVGTIDYGTETISSFGSYETFGSHQDDPSNPTTEIPTTNIISLNETQAIICYSEFDLIGAAFYYMNFTTLTIPDGSDTITSGDITVFSDQVIENSYGIDYISLLKYNNTKFIVAYTQVFSYVAPITIRVIGNMTSGNISTDSTKINFGTNSTFWINLSQDWQDINNLISSCLNDSYFLLVYRLEDNSSNHGEYKIINVTSGLPTNYSSNITFADNPSSLSSSGFLDINHSFVIAFRNGTVPRGEVVIGNLIIEASVPDVSGPNPALGATAVSTSLATVNVTINQTEGDLFNWTIEGSFLDSNSSTSDTTGIKEANVTGVLSDLTLYVWYVNASDKDGYNNKTYYFTTISSANQSPTFSYPNPSNNSYGNNLTLEWNITIEDPEGDDFNWTINVSDGSFNSSNYSVNGSYSISLADLQGNTTYTVWANVTDGNGSKNWTNETFSFRTNSPLVFSNPNPANGSIDVLISTASWNITIEDPEGSTFNWSIDVSDGVGGSYGFDNNNGSKSCSLVGLDYWTNYTVWVNATDNMSKGGSNISTNETFYFTTGNESNIYVDDDQAPSWYSATNVSTITEGIANATNGTTKNIYVFPGTYTGWWVLNKYVNITAINGSNDRPQLNGRLNISEYIYGPISIENLSINASVYDRAVYVRRANYITFINCNITSLRDYNLLVQGRYCNFSYCNITGGFYRTVLISTISSWTTGSNTLWFCNISGWEISAQYCIEIASGADGNEFIGNSIYDTAFAGATTAVQVSSDNNLFYHNNFINNINHSIDSGSGNIWNETYGTYPSNIIGGNYWQGEDTTDTQHGPNQDIGGADAICDSPYGKDKYPLVNPFYGTLYLLQISDPTPSNGSINASLWLPNVSVNITGTDPFNYTITGIYINDTDNNGTGATSGIYYANISNPLPINTEIIWYVNVTDGNNTSNKTYHFYTNQQPFISTQFPVNESTISWSSPLCRVVVNDPDGDTMDICWYQNVSGTWILNQTNLSVSNGTYRWVYQEANTTFNTYYWMVTVNDSYTNVTYVYNFNLVTNRTWKNITEWNGTVFTDQNNTEFKFWRSPVSTWSGRISNQSHGGTYQINILFENETNGRNFPVNLEMNNTGIHSFIIHFNDETDYVLFNHNGVYGSHDNTTACDVTNNRSGNFSVTVNKQVKYFEFRWNDSDGRIYRCTRFVIPSTFSVTMYIRIDLPVYGESTATFNNSIVKYKLAFLDETGQYRHPNNPRVIIYKYNSSGTQQIIHSEYFDPSGRVYPWLVYGEIYYLGAACDTTSIERIGEFYAGSDIEQNEIRIPFEEDLRYSFFDLIQLRIGNTTSLFYVNYTDTTLSNIWVEFTVYNYTNDTLILSSVQNQSFVNTFNFTFTIAMGYSSYENYKFQINVSLSGLTNEHYEGVYSSGKIPIFAHAHLSISNRSIDNLFTLLFGGSPIYDSDNPLVYVPWTYILVFVVSLILLLSFGKLNAFLGGLAVGFWLVFAGILISGISVLYNNYTWWNGPTLSVIGAFIIILSFVGLLGGVER